MTSVTSEKKAAMHDAIDANCQSALGLAARPHQLIKQAEITSHVQLEILMLAALCQLMSDRTPVRAIIFELNIIRNSVNA